tara:strand:- start:196 stop:363 length:168 start_codon:yes stop_codon:yes gene_type:complete
MKYDPLVAYNARLNRTQRANIRRQANSQHQGGHNANYRVEPTKSGQLAYKSKPGR